MKLSEHMVQMGQYFLDQCPKDKIDKHCLYLHLHGQISSLQCNYRIHGTQFEFINKILVFSKNF